MTDVATTPAADAETTETTAPEHVDGEVLEDGTTYVRTASDGSFVTVETLAEAAKAADGSKVDVPRFNSAFAEFRTQFSTYGALVRQAKNMVPMLAALILETRLAVILKNGDPDYWGKSEAYTNLFSDRILGFMRAEGFSAAETETYLTNIRTNYFRTNRSVIEEVARQEVKRGNVEKMRGVKAAAVEGDTIVITYDKTDAEGDNVTETYTVGDAEMPKPLQNAIKAAAQRSDKTTTGRKVTPTLPAVVVPKPDGPGTPERANAKGTNQRNYADQARAAFVTLTECIGHVSLLEMLGSLHEWTTDVSDYAIGEPGSRPSWSDDDGGLPGGPKAVGEAMYGPGNLLLKTGAVLAGSGNKTDVAKFRADRPETTENENENDDDGAADAAATA